MRACGRACMAHQSVKQRPHLKADFADHLQTAFMLRLQAVLQSSRHIKGLHADMGPDSQRRQRLLQLFTQGLCSLLKAVYFKAVPV